MTLARHVIIAASIVEAAYPANIGFEEMVKFYRVATPQQVAEMEGIIAKGDFAKFKEMIHRVLHVSLF